MSENTRKKLDFIINIVYVMAVALVIYIGFKILQLAYPFVIALFLVALFRPLIMLIYRKFKVNQKIASVTIIVLLYVAVGTLIFWLITQSVFLLRDALTAFPDYYKNTIAPLLTTLSSTIDEWMSVIPSAWSVELETIQNSLMNGLQNLIVSFSEKGISVITSFINTIPSFLFSLIFTILLSLFMSFQYDAVMAFLKKQLPSGITSSLTGIKGIFKNTIFKYMKAILILMFITFVELTIGFIILGTPGALRTAALIAIFDALPIFGTGGIMIPWVLLELLQGNFSYAIGLAALYGVVTLVRNVIEPKVIGDQLGLNPIVSLMAVYIGYRLFGVIGMITFPMLAQVLLVLHENGTIKLYKGANTSD